MIHELNIELKIRIGDYKEGFEGADADYRALLKSDSYPTDDLFFLFLGVKPSKKKKYEEHLKCMMELRYFCEIKRREERENIKNVTHVAGKLMISEDELNRMYNNLDTNILIDCEKARCELLNSKGKKKEKCLRKWQDYFLPKYFFPADHPADHKDIFNEYVERSERARASAWDNRCNDGGFVQELYNFVQIKSLKGRININKQVWKEKLEYFKERYPDKVKHIPGYLLKDDCQGSLEELQQANALLISENKKLKGKLEKHQSTLDEKIICGLKQSYLKGIAIKQIAGAISDCMKKAPDVSSIRKAFKRADRHLLKTKKIKAQ
jgi:hypothetical protein